MNETANPNPSLNLTPERGPSVWAEAERSRRLSTMLITGGSLLAAFAWTSRSRHRMLLASLGASAMAYGLFADRDRLSRTQPVSNVMNRLRPTRLAELDDVDKLSKQSFPASDAPAVY